MNTLTQSTLTSVLVLAGALGATLPASSGATLDETLAQTVLVRANVVSVKAQDATVIGQLEITHVYAGLVDLRGRTFAAESSGADDSIGTRLTPALEAGENCLWCLKDRNGTLTPIRYPQHGLVWPVREKFTPRYAEAKALAETIERMSKTPAAARPALLKELVTSETPEVSAWAVRAAANAGLPDAPSFLHQLATSARLSVPGQVALDEVLSESDPAWKNSAPRQRLLEKWLSGPCTDYDASTALTRLDAILQHSELSDATLLGLLKTTTTNEQLPLDIRRGAVRLIAMLAKRSEAGSEAFKQLLAQIQSAKESELRLAAAHALKNFVPLDATRADQVRAAKASSSDRQVADVLGQALERERKP